MNYRTAKRLLVTLLLCLQLGNGLPAPSMLAAVHGAPTTAAPHCAHAMAGTDSAHATGASMGASALRELSPEAVSSGQASHRSNHAGCCVEAGCSCACLVAAFAPQPTLYASATLQSIPLPPSIGALPRPIDSTLRPPI